ncbi:MAG TPA: hypothetical protein VIS96_17420 [Terrimicrobiaceae bacterium]
MKTIRQFILKVTRKSSPVCTQMELALPGSRLTRDEASFLREIRQMRAQLAKSPDLSGKAV